MRRALSRREPVGVAELPKGGSAGKPDGDHVASVVMHADTLGRRTRRPRLGAGAALIDHRCQRDDTLRVGNLGRPYKRTYPGVVASVESR